MAEIPAAGDRPGLTIDVSWASALVVDDVEENRDLLVRRLRRLGVVDIEQAANGREALARLDERNFDLLLLDIMMPEMNGYEVLDVLSRDGRTHQLPVLVISALSEIDAVARCLEQGAEDFIFKPFNPIILRARVLASLEKKQLRDGARRELERKRAELGEARNLQLALAPEAADRTAPLGRIAIEAVLEPAREVGGDLVDHFEIGEGLHVVLVGDVSDKGAGAALVMARTHAQFRALAARPDAETLFADPAKAVSAVNEALAANNPSCMFVTLFLGALDVTTGEFAYVRCGHVPPWIRRADGRIERLEAAAGLPLGVMEGAPYRSSRAILASGEVMLVVTDGVTEGAAPDKTLYGEERVGVWLDAAGLKASLPALVAEVRAHEAGEPASDDVAAVLLKIPTGELIWMATLELQLVLDTDGISAAVERAQTWLEEEQEVDARAAMHVALTLDELLTNASTHGGAGGKDAGVRLEVGPDRVTVQITDPAAEFDPRQAPAPDLDARLEDKKIGGLGVHLVMKLSRDLTYARDKDRNRTKFWIARSLGHS